ncbi:hypothetical protein AB1285_25320 [Microbacterium sp. NRRL B-14842]
MTLPPIDEWWPELSDDARRAVIDSGSRHLDEDVRERSGRSPERWWG